MLVIISESTDRHFQLFSPHSHILVLDVLVVGLYGCEGESDRSKCFMSSYRAKHVCVENKAMDKCFLVSAGV